MRVCGVEIKSNEAFICLMELEEGLFQLPDCRQVRFQLTKDHSQENVQKFQFALRKLIEDYQITDVVIKERAQKGKFAGAAVGFKIEAALQLLDNCATHIMTGSEQKEKLKRHPMPVDFEATGLKMFQKNAFIAAYAFLAK